MQRAALFTSSVQYDKILGQQQLVMVNYVCGFNQSEMGKYFEWIIVVFITPTVVIEMIFFLLCFLFDLSQT